MAMDLTFNIIFVPGTVRYLRLAILSLLKYSNYHYRLISNGVQPAEQSQLKQFCSTSDRLEFYAYPTKTTLAHGTLLNLLQYRERTEHFCFMDPDIFASAPFQEELESHLKDGDVFSSCSHLGMDSDGEFTGVKGRCLRAPNGLALATTFFCVYRTAQIRRVIAGTGVGFERYSHEGTIPETVKDHLKEIGLSDRDDYDTGKLLNVLSHSYNLRYRYHPLAGLTHIGGIGRYFMKGSWRTAWKQQIRRLARRPYVLRDDDFEPKVSAFRRLMLRPNTATDSEPASKRAHQVRRHVALFFTAFLQSLLDGTPEPVLAITNHSLAQRISRLCKIIRELYEEHQSCSAA